MKKIKLTQGKFALVDDEDFEELSKYKWVADNFHTVWYARRYIKLARGKYSSIRMHRVIMKAPKGVEIDHINCNGLDNRKENLRFCTSSQNKYNKPKRKSGSSKYKGVHAYYDGRWAVHIQAAGLKMKQIGVFNTQEEAARAYDAAARKYHGEFAYLNFPNELR